MADDIGRKIIRDTTSARRYVANVRDAASVIILSKGAYDILHVGHVLALQSAKNLGTYLVVAVASDRSIMSRKGPKRPILPWEHRALMVAALDMVDLVTEYDHESPRDVIFALAPDIFVASHLDSLPKGSQEEMANVGIRCHLVAKPSALSTSAIIDRILQRYQST